MMTLSAQTQSPAYALAEGLQESASASTARLAPWEESAREDLLLRKLGPKGWGCVYHFLKYYEEGWGEKKRVLSPKAVEAFFRFVEKAEFPANIRSPSVFLTDLGGLELCWEDLEGKAIQVEFTGTGAEFYLAATEEEAVMKFDGLAHLWRRLGV